MHEIIIGHKIQDKTPESNSSDYTMQIDEFKKNKQPKIVLLHQSGCGACEGLDWSKMKSEIKDTIDKNLVIAEIEHEYIAHKNDDSHSKIKLKTDIVGYPTILYIDERKHETEVDRNKIVDFLLNRKPIYKYKTKKHRYRIRTRKHRILYPDIRIELSQIKKLVSYIESKLENAE
jgi:hypothetical protein